MEEEEFNENNINDKDFMDKLGIQDSDIKNEDYSNFSDNPNLDQQNLIEWQLDFKKDLEEIRLYLSGYKEGYDDKGNWTYLPPKEDEEVPFNEFGVNVIMGHIRAYLNRNTVLSHYDEKRIKKILFDLGNKLGDEIEQTYEKLGMDTAYKQRRFKLIVLNILNMSESAYRRALKGGERESLRTNRQVSQTESIGNNPINMPGKRGGRFSLFKPKTW